MSDLPVERILPDLPPFTNVGVRSDYGTNFIGTKRKLREALRDPDHAKMQSPLARRGIEWTFNPPAGSHHGGVWADHSHHKEGAVLHPQTATRR